MAGAASTDRRPKANCPMGTADVGGRSGSVVDQSVVTGAGAGEAGEQLVGGESPSGSIPAAASGRTAGVSSGLENDGVGRAGRARAARSDTVVDDRGSTPPPTGTLGRPTGQRPRPADGPDYRRRTGRGRSRAPASIRIPRPAESGSPRAELAEVHLVERDGGADHVRAERVVVRVVAHRVRVRAGLLGGLHPDVAVAVETGTRRDQLAEDDVLLQADERVALALDRRVREDLGRLLEGGRPTATTRSPATPW